MNLKEMRAKADRSALPREICPACGRSTPIRVGGELREHLDAAGEKCPASGYTLEKWDAAHKAKGLIERAREELSTIEGAPVDEGIAAVESDEDERLSGKLEPPPPPAPRSPEEEMLSQSFAILPTDRVVPDPANRVVGDISELVESIRVNGILEPVLVVPDLSAPNIDEMPYRLISGHRRRAAAEELGILGIPALIRTFEQIEGEVAALVTNVQRKDLTPLEEANGYRRLMDHGLDQKAIAEQVGRSQGHVSKRLALLKLPDPIQEAVNDGKVTLETAQQVGRLRNPKAMLAAWEQVVDRYAHVEREIAEGDGDGGPLQEADADAYRQEAFAETDQTLRWIAERAIQQADAEARRRKAVKEAEAAGLTVVPEDTFVTYPLKWDAGPRRIGRAYGYINANPEQHAKEPCHVVTIGHDGKVVPGCSKPERHKRGGSSKLTTTISDGGRGTPRTKTPKETAEQKEARLAMETAEARMEDVQRTRRSWVSIQTNGIKPDVVAFLNAHAFLNVEDDYVEAETVGACLGLDLEGSSWGKASQELEKLLINGAGEIDPKAARRLLAAQVVALYEGNLLPFSVVHTPKGRKLETVSWTFARPYFDWLESTGYQVQPEEIERLEITEKGRRAS